MCRPDEVKRNPGNSKHGTSRNSLLQPTDYTKCFALLKSICLLGFCFPKDCVLRSVGFSVYKPQPRRQL